MMSMLHLHNSLGFWDRFRTIIEGNHSHIYDFSRTWWKAEFLLTQKLCPSTSYELYVDSFHWLELLAQA